MVAMLLKIHKEAMGAQRLAEEFICENEGKGSC
jgi:hypothetical protein